MRNGHLDPLTVRIDDPRLGEERNLGPERFAVDVTRSKTDSCCEIGNSELVMVVGSVNVGIAVSTLPLRSEGEVPEDRRLRDRRGRVGRGSRRRRRRRGGRGFRARRACTDQ